MNEAIRQPPCSNQVARVLESVQCFSSKKKIYWEYVEKEVKHVENNRENGTAMRIT
jgi:hypothetical protein